jgi:hypothetical protein
VLPQEQTDTDVAGLEDGSGRFRPSGTSCALRGESVSAIGFGVIGLTSASPKSVDFLQMVLGLPDNPHGGRFAGVAGINWDGVGAANTYGAGVLGRSDSQSGVVGLSNTARGVWGASETFMGTVGDSASGTGVWGHSRTGQGVYALSDAGDGLVAETKGAQTTGVIGKSPSGRGVWGWSESFMGTVGDSVSSSGLFGHSQSGAGVYAISDSSRGLLARGVPAGRFEGDVEVTGDIKLANGDCAEDFPTADPSRLEPGDVLVIDETGSLRRCAAQACGRQVRRRARPSERAPHSATRRRDHGVGEAVYVTRVP